MYRCPVVVQLAWHAAAGEYRIRVSIRSRRAGQGKQSARLHGAEVGYVFGTLGANFAQADSRSFGCHPQYWTNFAKTGDPNGGNLPKWPKFDTAARGYIEFTDNGPVIARRDCGGHSAICIWKTCIGSFPQTTSALVSP